MMDFCEENPQQSILNHMNSNKRKSQFHVKPNLWRSPASMELKVLRLSKGASGIKVRFQVEAPVTRRSPHRPGLEDFPHPVPRFRFFYQTINHPGDTPSGARLCYPFRLKYYGLSSAGVTDKSFEDPQRVLYLCGSFGSANVAKPSPCVQRLPPKPCSCF